MKNILGVWWLVIAMAMMLLSDINTGHLVVDVLWAGALLAHLWCAGRYARRVTEKEIIITNNNQ